MTSFIKSPDHIHIVFDCGQSTTVYKSQPSFDAIVDAAKAKQWELARSIAFPVNEIKEQINTATSITDKVRIEHGIVYLGDKAMHGTLVDRMLAMIDEGFDVTPMAHFLANLHTNPSFRAVNELYGFLEKSKLPITDDGHFLAYKRVSADFKDIRTGTFDNSPGALVSMERNGVNEDKDQTCSTGLHFCSHDYLPSYANCRDNRTIMIKINPSDVVAIPSDYNDAKGRCCRYVVVSEMEKEATTAMPVESARIEDTKVMVVNPGAVRQIQLDKRFPNLQLVLMTHDSVDAAAEATGINKAAIKRVCNGKRKSTGGFGWVWATHKNTKVSDPDDAYRMELEDDAESDSEVEAKLWSIK